MLLFYEAVFLVLEMVMILPSVSSALSAVSLVLEISLPFPHVEFLLPQTLLLEVAGFLASEIVSGGSS